MSQLCLNLLGAFDAKCNGISLKLPRNKAKALLAYLAMPTGRICSRDEVCRLLWSRSSEEQARASLRQVLFVLRRSLPEEFWPISLDDDLSLDARSIALDVGDFADAAVAGSISDLERASELYRGPFLQGISLREDGFEEWIAVERVRLEGIAVSVMTRLVKHYLLVSRHDDAIAFANRILSIDHLHEEAHRALIRSYCATGSSGLARMQYEICRKALYRELGVVPAEKTQLEIKNVVCGHRSPAQSLAQSIEHSKTQEVKFCHAFDGIKIAYATVGDGPPLVKAPNWMTHLEYEWESPVWRHFLGEFSKNRTLIRFDQRGNGLSDRDVANLSFDSFVRDLEAVVDELNIDRFPLLGISQGCAISIAYAVRHPERVSKLILYGGFVFGAAKRDPESCGVSDAINTLIRHGWGQDNSGIREMYAAKLIPGGTKEQMDWYTELMRVSASPENALLLREAMSQVDISDLLPAVQAPTLVLHARNDAIAPFEEGRTVAAQIPNARFVALDGKNHILLEDEPAWSKFVEEVMRFLEMST
ncbi:Arylesterase [Roseibium album]|nr:Arylesterase [Roseibium album]